MSLMLESSYPSKLCLMAIDSCPDVKDLLCVPRSYIYKAAPFICVLEVIPCTHPFESIKTSVLNEITPVILLLS